MNPSSNRHPRRVAPLPAAEWDDRVRASLASLLAPERSHPDGAGNVLSTLVRHPDLVEAYLPFNAYLLRGSTLSPRVREVALLRAVHQRECPYLWSHHLPLAARVGLSPDDISAIAAGTCRDPVDRLVVRAVDDLVADNTISEATWQELATVFTDRQRMDLVFTIGGYLLLGMFVNTFGIQDEHRS